MHFRRAEGQSSQGLPWRQIPGDKQTILPMHAKKELKTGLMNGIRKALGLK
jgi:hypothetical protein